MLNEYIKTVRAVAHLTPEQEKTATPAQLVAANLDLPIYVAKHRNASRDNFADIVQEGNAALIVAASSFDTGRGKFAPYAMFVIGRAVGEYLRVNAAIVTPGKWMYNKHGALAHSANLEDVFDTRTGEPVEDRVMLSRAVEQLNAIQRDVVRYLSEGHPARVVAEWMGVSRQRIEQIRDEALGAMGVTR